MQSRASQGQQVLKIYVVTKIKSSHSDSKQKEDIREALGDFIWQRLNEDSGDQAFLQELGAFLEELETGMTVEDDSEMWHPKAQPTQF